MGDEAVAVETTSPHFTLLQLQFLTSLPSVQLNIKHIYIYAGFMPYMLFYGICIKEGID